MNWQSILLWIALTPAITSAQVALDWQTIDAGGGRGAGGAYTLVGTMGHVDAATLSGGTYSLAGGFSGGIVMQPPGPPALSINQTTSKIILSWPVSSVNYQLQENITLSITGPWSAAARPRTTNSGRIRVTIPLSSGSQFYRLKSE
jgi:hypothetical protein